MRGILLDLDNTLVDDRHATEQGFRTFVAAHGLRSLGGDSSADLTRWQVILDKHWERYEKHEISFQEQRRCRVREYLGVELEDEAADTAYAAYQRGYESAFRRMPSVTAFLNRTVDIPKVIITNGQREAQIKKIRATELEPHIVGLVTPTDCGHSKPSFRIFEAALAMLQLSASDCLMIGDDLLRDIEPARGLGMSGYHIQPGGSLLEAIAGATVTVSEHVRPRGHY